MTQKIKLLRPQIRFLNLPHKYRAYVAGYRAGKTWAGCTVLVKHSLDCPGVKLGYYAPTYPLIRDIFFETIARVAHTWKLRVDIKENNKEVHLYSGRNYLTTIMCRSMEKPANLIGYQHGSALVDEIDTLPERKANLAWNAIAARNSLKHYGQNRIDVTTTPEGFRFTYNRFVKSVREDVEKGSPLNLSALYGMIQASTFENEKHLDADYIPSLLATYDRQVAKAYLYGKFVNLTSGTVYVQYDRKKNRSTETIQPHDILYIGMDFNIDHMAAVVFVKRDGLPHAVDEIIDAFDTPKMIKLIKERFWPYKDGDYDKSAHQIWIYPDSSGKNRTRVGAGANDIELLRQAGFSVSAHPANPPVRDRVNTMNAMFCNAEGIRRSFVNDSKCPTYTENLEQQAYAGNGEPDKSSGRDHALDAAGYFHYYVYPLRKPVSKLNIRVAM